MTLDIVPNRESLKKHNYSLGKVFSSCFEIMYLKMNMDNR